MFDFQDLNFIPSPLLIETRRPVYWFEAAAKKVFQAQSIKQIERRSHPDWIHLSGEDLKMEALRDSLYQFRLKPYQEEKKILSIENFHECSSHIQNALLKSLEEPLEYWVILLHVHSAFGILPTIRSRCLLYRDPESLQAIELSEEENQLFSAIQNRDDFRIYALQENWFKDREKFRRILTKLLTKASLESYPGHWLELSPKIEEALPLLDRNLHPKNVWESLWNKAA